MSPLDFKSKSEEKLASTETITITDNATSDIYSRPKPAFKSRFRHPLSPNLRAHIDKLATVTEDTTDKPDSAKLP